ncbi:DUF3147 family protein [Acidicapsa ligni]|uniref:DUF3147 family protein n=1 Tax=Acidicapsa ligni TaxID=542300 RepID=UPI0037C142B9
MINTRFSALKDIKPHEYALRFMFGGLCTVCAGLIAQRYGPCIGGLFLAFPAIFPAGASLLEKHEREKKRKAGFDGTKRGRMAAGVDAAGTAIGCVGLIGFAVTIRLGLPRYDPALAIATAVVVWLVLSVMLWLLLKSRMFRRIRG